MKAKEKAIEKPYDLNNPMECMKVITEKDKEIEELNNGLNFANDEINNIEKRYHNLNKLWQKRFDDVVINIKTLPIKCEIIGSYRHEYIHLKDVLKIINEAQKKEFK